MSIFDEEEPGCWVAKDEFSSDDIREILESHGYTNFRRGTQYNCGSTGYTRYVDVCDTPDGELINVDLAYNKVRRETLKHTLMWAGTIKRKFNARHSSDQPGWED